MSNFILLRLLLAVAVLLFISLYLAAEKALTRLAGRVKRAPRASSAPRVKATAHS